jgi:hypothetical protein
VCALSPDRHTAAVAHTPVTAKIHQTLYIHRSFTAKFALDLEIPVDDIADTADLIITQFVGPYRPGNLGLGTDLRSTGSSNAVDIGQSDPNRLIG